MDPVGGGRAGEGDGKTVLHDNHPLPRSVKQQQIEHSL